MASRKLTALPTATEVTTSDKIYIVDVSDTSESPQGTSKQAVISELPVITTLTSTDGSIDIDLTDPSAPDLSIADYAIPLAGTTEMQAAEITHTSTGKTATLGFVDGSVYLVSTGAAGTGALATSASTAIIQYDAAVSGYSSLVTCADGVINLGVNGNILALEFDGSENKVGFFLKSSTPSALADPIADATDATDVITKFNTLLAAMRAYGLIAE